MYKVLPVVRRVRVDASPEEGAARVASNGSVVDVIIGNVAANLQ